MEDYPTSERPKTAKKRKRERTPPRPATTPPTTIATSPGSITSQGPSTSPIMGTLSKKAGDQNTGGALGFLSWARNLGGKLTELVMGKHEPTLFEALVEEILEGAYREVEDRLRQRTERQASIQIQCMIRCFLARRRATRLLALAREANRRAATERNQQYNEAIRCRVRTRKLVASLRGKVAASFVGRVVEGGERPYCARQIQRVWRGHRGRKAAQRRRLSLLEHQQAAAEQKAFHRALLHQRRERGGKKDAAMSRLERLMWARSKFIHSGWKPSYDISGNYDPLNYIHVPPQGPKQGLRIVKVRLPVGNSSDYYRVKNDRSTWMGIPVGTEEVPEPPCRLGPPPRYNTKKMEIRSTITDARIVPPRKPGAPLYTTLYQWFPASMVTDKDVLVGQYVPARGLHARG